jgi:hypothetical protein
MYGTLKEVLLEQFELDVRVCVWGGGGALCFLCFITLDTLSLTPIHTSTHTNTHTHSHTHTLPHTHSHTHTHTRTDH